MAESPRYESAELSRRGLFAGAATLLGCLVICVGVSLVLARIWLPAPLIHVVHPDHAGRLTTPREFTGSGLDPALATTRAEVEAEWQARARSYTLLEGETPQAARIPVERAIELICAGAEPSP